MNVFFLVFFCNSVTAVKHYLEYFSTATSGFPEFPEMMGMANVDRVYVGSCSMVIHRTEPRDKLIKKFIEENAEHIRWYYVECQENQGFFNSIIDGLMKRTNQTGGKHVFQQYCGCEWDDETGKTKGFDRYAYDGEDFLRLDLQKHEWTALSEKALVTKLSWENDDSVKHSEYFFTIQCPDWLKTYLAYAREYIHRTVFPSVSLLQKSSSSLISCHATGFFPDTVDLFWMKDGEEFHEGVEKGEILPNDDESFQMSVHLNTSSLTPEDWKHFSCVFQFSGSRGNITVSLDKTKIRSNHDKNKNSARVNTGSSSRNHWGAGAALFLLVPITIWIFVCKRKNKDLHVDEEPMM
ncbi:major histocompatibility complex class I-related gene protein-like [Oryzias melastigma]|uniref:major histocompatibility complex class I-related gene protein-like n=1 Tax=Oryzias melastigma TaxID=30732 RepID=UPI00168D0609|nr:major histocompatibility complex class I-related gene protein-like [Oryzias melastigma]